VTADASYTYHSEQVSRFMDCLELNRNIRQNYIIQSIKVFLALHALSGSDYTSHIRNVTKSTLFTTYCQNPTLYIEDLSILPATAIV
ncbi:unnamed protein product, partial [Didymodactylos carnosus]